MLRLSLKTLYKALGSKRYFDARLEAGPVAALEVDPADADRVDWKHS